MVPDHRDRTIYGALAYLGSCDGIARYAERQSLFPILASGDIANAPNLRPRDYA